MNQSLFPLLEQTSRSIFLTGKAGTGKTTFLNEFVGKTRKKYVICAPTGIAAINAGGVTLHSLFGLPLRPFLPTTERLDGSLGNNISDLISHFKYRKDKVKLFRELEILIIDEVSMLRADVMDMVEFALRFVRRSTLPFGGVQLFLVGDLFQLPPVVRDEGILSKYYQSPFFFSAKALEQVNILTIELTKVYRQKDEKLIATLNAIREGDITNIDFDLLNSRYRQDFKPKESYVYLTSHNKMAEDINQGKLDEIKAKLYSYPATVIGNFKENQFPNEHVLKLKVGAQIMFIRNDASGEKKYYNGKLATVSSLKDDNIYVTFDDSQDEYRLKKEIWEQKAYSIGEDKKIQEEVLGSFEQYPIRLAWAVTIHKSQGLTFDRVIIDAGKAFAAGQVYVALSRSRSLEGLILTSKITPEIIIKDNRVLSFQDQTLANDQMEEILSRESVDYAIGKLIYRVNPLWINAALESWHNEAITAKKLQKQDVQNLYNGLKVDLKHLSGIFQKFEKVLRSLVKKYTEQSIDWTQVHEKSQGAAIFFYEQVFDKIIDPLNSHYSETKGVTGLKGYNEVLKDFLDELKEYLQNLQELELLEEILIPEDKHKDLSKKTVKLPSHIQTFQLFEKGMPLDEIQKNRGLVKETVLGHFSKFAQNGVLGEKDLERIVAPEHIKAFENLWNENKENNLKQWKQILPDEMEYGEIRLLINYHNNLV